MSRETAKMDNKEQKSKKALSIYLIFFIIMVAFIAISPYIAMHNVEKKSKLSPKERIEH